MPIAESALCKVSVRPSNIAGLVVALLFGRAGDGAAIGEDWYHFRRGAGFVRDDLRVATRCGAYDIIPIRPASQADREYLEGLVGEPWKWWRNCFCVTRRLWRAQR